MNNFYVVGLLILSKGVFLVDSMIKIDHPKNILLTGCSGNLGKLIVKNFPDFKIFGIDTILPSYVMPNNFNFLSLDIINNQFTEVLTNLHPDIVIHAAFTVNPTKEKWNAIKTNILGTKHVLEASIKANVQHIIYISSTLAYGVQKIERRQLTENQPLLADKTFLYAYHKRIVEEKICKPFIRQHPKQLFTILRPSGILGPDINNYITKTFSWPIIPFISEGRFTRIQWLHQEDFIFALKLVIAESKEGIFNITPDYAESFSNQRNFIPKKVIYLPEKLSRAIGRLGWYLNFLNVPPGYLDYVRYEFLASNKKAKKILGWSPKYSTKQALMSLFLSKFRFS